jgi:hypothetical protein
MRLALARLNRRRLRNRGFVDYRYGVRHVAAGFRVRKAMCQSMSFANQVAEARNM